MSNASAEADTNRVVIDSAETKVTATPSQPEWSVPEFHDGLGDHPLWQEFMDEMRAIRQADIAEANRLADLELEK